MRLQKIFVLISMLVIAINVPFAIAEENTITTVELLRQTAEQARGANYWTAGIKSKTDIEELIGRYISALRSDYEHYSKSPQMVDKHWIRSLVDERPEPKTKLHKSPLAGPGVLKLRKQLVTFSSEDAVRKMEDFYESNGVPTIYPKPPTPMMGDFYVNPFKKAPTGSRPTHVGDFGPRPRSKLLAE